MIANPGKNLGIEIENKKYLRIPIKTHIITKDDKILDVFFKYVQPKKNDIVFISERIIAIMQGRAYEIDKMNPSFFAKHLSKLVHKSPYGIGLASPYTMQLAIETAGLLRIFLAGIISVIGKIFGQRGWFYKVAGNSVNAIDGPCDYTIPPYNNYAKLGPKHPNKIAKEISEKLNIPVIIIDANDLGVEILGKSDDTISTELAKKLFKDNPLGQGKEQTPICIVRNSI